MEIRAFTIKYSKRKTKKKRGEEKALQTKLISIQNKLEVNYNESMSTARKIANIFIA